MVGWRWERTWVERDWEKGSEGTISGVVSESGDGVGWLIGGIEVDMMVFLGSVLG